MIIQSSVQKNLVKFCCLICNKNTQAKESTLYCTLDLVTPSADIILITAGIRYMT